MIFLAYFNAVLFLWCKFMNVTLLCFKFFQAPLWARQQLRLHPPSPQCPLWPRQPRHPHSAHPPVHHRHCRLSQWWLRSQQAPLPRHPPRQWTHWARARWWWLHLACLLHCRELHSCLPAPALPLWLQPLASAQASWPPHNSLMGMLSYDCFFCYHYFFYL